MRLFGRGARHAAAPAQQVAPEPAPEGAPPPSPPGLPPEGAYVTDGESLYRVANSIRDPRDGELIIELEDCRTLELILCSASVIADLRLCAVTPAAR